MGSVVTDPVADIVADVVATTRRGSLMYSRNRFHAPWGAAFPAADVAMFHVITAGACWLAVDGAEPAQLTRGDVVLFPSGAAHARMGCCSGPVAGHGSGGTLVRVGAGLDSDINIGIVAAAPTRGGGVVQDDPARPAPRGRVRQVRGCCSTS